MSAGVMPDVYRHTARKSTVSKMIKPSNVPTCSTPAPPYATYHHDNEKKQETIFDAIQCTIKLEEEIPPSLLETFVIVPDNETEQLPIKEDQDQRNLEAVGEIIEQILNQIVSSAVETTLASTTQIQRTMSQDTQDAHDVLDSIMNRCDENDHTDFLPSLISDRTETDVNKSVAETTPMECEEQVTIVSRSQMDDDIVEIEAAPSDHHSHPCTCQCHKPVSALDGEYLLFEQALKQSRQEQQQERLLNSNRLIQTLKRQHDELVSLYQQNKTQKSSTSAKIDREQQTLRLSVHDSQMQTESSSPASNGKTSSHQQKPLTLPTIKSQTTNNIVSQLSTPNYNGMYNSTQSSSPSTSTPPAPRLSAGASSSSTTTTVSSKKSTVMTKTAVVSNGPPTIPLLQPPPPPPPLPPTVSATASHDVVDLTEEDEDDTASRAPVQRNAPIRQSTAATHPPTPSAASTTTTTTTTATATATRLRPVNRAIRPNTTATNGQTFPLRPLPEHVPCDNTIARPQLSITQENATVRLTWNLLLTPMESIQNYEIYAYKQNATVTTSDWKKIGTVKSMRLPMAVTLKEFQSNSHYAFAVRAVSINNNVGPFCEPKTIFTGNTPVQPLHTSQLLNVPIS